MFSKLSMVEAQITESRVRPEGLLKVTTTVAFGSVWLTPRMTGFMEKYPGVRMSFLLDDEEVDLSMRVADVAIRFNQPRQPDLIQRQLVRLHYNIYASEAYLKKYGVPKEPADLNQHKLIVYGESVKTPVEGMNWLLSIDTSVPRVPVFTINNIYGIYRAVSAGFGIAALPNYFSSASSDLVHILPELRGPHFNCYFVYPEELRNSKRVSVFRDFLLKQLPVE